MPLLRRFGRPGLLGLAARTAVVAGTATAVTSGMVRRSQQRAQQDAEVAAYEAEREQNQIDQAATQAARTTPTPSPAGADIIDELQRLSTLHAQGVLTDDEYSQAKAKILA